VQNLAQDGRADISCTVASSDVQQALEVARRVAGEIGAAGVSCQEGLAKVSAVGMGMESEQGVAGKMFASLAAKQINVQMITTSEIKISALVERADADRAVQAVHTTFGLELAATGSDSDLDTATLERTPVSPLEVVQRLEGMEDLAIEDCQLDESQALVTFVDLPDTPGVAAEVFEEIGKAGLLVDMIVQSEPRNGKAELSFTVASENRELAATTARTIAEARGARVADIPHVAKLSITGVGIRSHSAIAESLFQPLAEAGINIDLVSTSEVRLNVVVASEQGEEAIAILRQALGLAEE
jgi:aspartate kinase